jgi:ubiquinone/menaquinone biosynthesis C-methylase UbiE
MENSTASSISTSSSDKTQLAEKLWDAYSLVYFESMNRSSLSLMSTLMALARISNKYRILDAGCGPGLGTKLITTGIPNLDSTVYALDFSNEMMKLSYKVFSEYDDFNFNTHNHFELCEPITGKKINIKDDTEEIRKTKIGKVVKLFQGNVENIIFEDEQFDVYISNLCLMLCQDANKAISEAYRVLKQGGVAAISIWGKKEDSKFAFKLFNEVFLKNGIDISGERSSYHLAEDIDALKLKFISAGFKNVRMDFTNAIFDCYDEQDYLVKFQGPGVNSTCRKINNDLKVKEMIEEVKDRAKEELNGTSSLPTLNCLVIVAFK